MTNTILVINAGSSSMKVAGYNADTGEQTFKATINAVADYDQAVKQALADIRGPVVGVGYRVVNGGRFNTAQVITPEVIEEITAATKYAPLHNPPALAGIAMLQKLYPAAKHVAVFDTAFFADMPDVARMYALPETLRKAYMRFGYHACRIRTWRSRLLLRRSCLSSWPLPSAPSIRCQDPCR